MYHVFHGVGRSLQKDVVSSLRVAKNKRTRPLQLLPDFDNGGVLVFWHVVKTGGVTVRKSFQEFQKWQKELHPRAARIIVKRSLERHDYRRISDTAEAILSQKQDKQILLWELHGPGVPSVFDMQEDLKKWRALAQNHGTVLFAFTLLRDPLEFAVSHYNFFHIIPRKSSNGITRNMEEQNLLESTIPNRQCSILSGGDAATVAEKTCQSLYQAMLQKFDWIGTTEQLSRETLPLLTQLLFHNATLASSIRSYNLVKNNNKNKQFLHASQLQPSTIERIQKMSQLDQFMWERAQLDYDWDALADNV